MNIAFVCNENYAIYLYNIITSVINCVDKDYLNYECKNDNMVKTLVTAERVTSLVAQYLYITA